MKSKILPIVLSILLTTKSSIVFANQMFEPNVEYAKYVSFENIFHSRFFSVSNSNGQNNKAIFDEQTQLTDFIFDTVSTDDNKSFIVSKIIDGVRKYGLIEISYFINDDYKKGSEIKYTFPLKYKNIEHKFINNSNVIILENFDGKKEYYLDKIQFEIDKSLYFNETYNIDYVDCGTFIKINSLEDIPDPKFLNNKKTPIQGLDGYYIMSGNSTGNIFNIVDKDGKKVIEDDFREIDNKISAGDTLFVWYPKGMQDLRAGILNKNLKSIVQTDKEFTEINLIESNGKVYIKATEIFTNNIYYYDLNGNVIKEPFTYKLIVTNISKPYSDWAETSIIQAINLNIVPQNLQSNFTANITRQEFCQLAIQLYAIKTGNEIDKNAKTPFNDVDDPYVTMAYNLKIVSGVGNNNFLPNNNITRQEAAVMLNNLASVLGINNNIEKVNNFEDEKDFASWAKNEIYNICGIKSVDTYIMTGTGNNKFSPLSNYTREQAIITMLRIFNY